MELKFLHQGRTQFTIRQFSIISFGVTLMVRINLIFYYSQCFINNDGYVSVFACYALNYLLVVKVAHGIIKVTV